MTKWEQFEEFLFEVAPLGGCIGPSTAIAPVLGETPAETSQIIQAYLDAQRSQTSRTLYVLRREGRTKSAIWYSGVRTADVRAIGHEYFEDVQKKFLRALQPDLTRVAARNPRAAKKCEAIIVAVGEGALTVLRAAVDGIDLEGDEE